MKTKWYVFGLLAAIGCVIGGVVAKHQKPAPVVTATKAQQPSPAVVEAPPAAAPEVTAPEVVPAPVEAPISPFAESSVKPKKIVAQNPAPKLPKEPLHDPDAREALALVGVDPEAERYWLDAIYDPSLPDNEREDLMEDLNEVGFDDLKNLTSDDLALIERRLQLLEEIAPYADDFMKPHLWEPYKDLTNMLANAPQP